jgi:hypothetical protein
VEAPGEHGIVELKTIDGVVYQIAYAIVNPVAAGLCWSPEDWPGLNILADEIGGRVVDAVFRMTRGPIICGYVRPLGHGSR